MIRRALRKPRANDARRAHRGEARLHDRACHFEAPIPQNGGFSKNVPLRPSCRRGAQVSDLRLCRGLHPKLRQEGLHKALLPLLDVIVSEPDGEEFLMLALKRTDERHIAVGKKISPSFLFWHVALAIRSSSAGAKQRG